MAAQRKKYLPRHRRVENPPRMWLTERDKEIVTAVYRMRFLTAQQVKTLLFQPDSTTAGPNAKLSNCRKRLRLLFHHGFLERRWRPVVSYHGSSPAVYCVTRDGLELVAEYLGVPKESLRWSRKDNKTSYTFLEHTLDVNTVRIAFLVAAQKHAHQVTRWIDESELKRREAKDYVWLEGPRGRKRRVAIVPDALFTYARGDKHAHFFLEVDRGTEESRRFQRRVRAYILYRTNGQYRRRYGAHSLRVLTVTTSNQRLKNLKQATERVGGQSLFWFTTMAQATPERILGPVWEIAGQEGKHRLFG